jgi:hypothetical protein
MRIRVLIVPLTLLVSSALSAQEAPDPRAVQPERPTVATHAGTVAPGYVEVEAGVERDALRGDASQVFTPALVKIGLAPRVQFNVASSWVRNAAAGASTSGIGDLTVGLKVRLADAAPLLGRFAVVPSIKLPTGSARRRTGTGTTDAGLLLISSHTVGPAAVDANVSYTRRSGDGTIAPRDETLWAVAAGAPVQGALGVAVELFGYPGTSGPGGYAPTTALLAGPTFQARPWLFFDAGVLRRLSGPQPNAAYAGVTYNAGRLPVGRPAR